VPRPIPDRDGGFLNQVDGYEVQVFEYLDGRALEDETEWPDELYARVAQIVAAVHASTEAVAHLVERVERYDLPFLPPFAETLATIEAGGALPAGDDPTLVTLRAIVAPHTAGLWAALERIQDLRDRASERDAEEVLCHTDVWGSNLLLSAGGRLHLLDWNGALLGPPEHDLFMFAGTGFFPADRFAWFLARYERGFRRIRLDGDRFGFYFYRRNLEDLAWFVTAIAEGDMEAMGPDAMLRVVAGLLEERSRLESRIEGVATVLGGAPRSA
jgi:Ser/Thr protein kinase RdoA (MazF antagonist)